jgi:hypothetical protein
MDELLFTDKDRERTDIEIRNMNYYKNYRLDLLELIRQHKFIPTSILSAYCDRDKSLSIKKIKSFMKKFKLIDQESVRVKGHRGTTFLFDQVENRMKESLDLEAMSVDSEGFEF